MDSQGWDPGDLRLQRGNRKVVSGSRRVNLYLHDGFSGGWKRKELMDSRRILRRSGKSRKERQGKSNLKVSLGPENDLELGNDMVGNGNHSVEEDVMEFDETRIDVEGNEKVISGDDEFQNLTDGEVEEPDNLQEVLDETKEVINYLGDAGDMGIAIGNEEKKNGSRKVLFKNTTLAEGTSKNRFIQAVLSPRKCVQATAGNRHGEGVKQTKEKGPSNHKPSSLKPYILFMDIIGFEELWWECLVNFGFLIFGFSISSVSISFCSTVEASWLHFGLLFLAYLHVSNHDMVMYWNIYGVLDSWHWNWYETLHLFVLKCSSDVLSWIRGDYYGWLGIEWYTSWLAVMVLVSNGMPRKSTLFIYMHMDRDGWPEGLGVWSRTIKLWYLFWCWVNMICLIVSTAARNYNLWILIIRFGFLIVFVELIQGSVYWRKWKWWYSQYIDTRCCSSGPRRSRVSWWWDNFLKLVQDHLVLVFGLVQDYWVLSFGWEFLEFNLFKMVGYLQGPFSSSWEHDQIVIL